MQSNFRVASLSIIVAFMLTIMPLPDWAVELRPDWVTLVLIYWAMALPTRFGVTIAWIFGILLDVSTGSILGQHALGMVLAIYIVHEQHQRLRVASLLQQAIVVLFLLLMKQLIVLWVNGIVGRAPDTWLFFLQSVIGAVIWPWIYIIMRDLRRKFGYRVDY
jgi:rod shape-determining protein MreD